MTEKIATQLEPIRIQKVNYLTVSSLCELVFRRVPKLADDIDITVHADFPNEISKRRKKQRPRLKKAREEGKIAFFSKPEPDKLFTNGRFVP